MNGPGLSAFRKALAELINEHTAENGSNTPDFILASYLDDCLTVFDRHVLAREDWYGHRHEPGGTVTEGLGSQETL